jgi:hypothetical protein
MIEVELPLKARLAGHVLVTLELTHLRVAYAIEFFIFFWRLWVCLRIQLTWVVALFEAHPSGASFFTNVLLAGDRCVT